MKPVDNASLEKGIVATVNMPFPGQTLELSQLSGIGVPTPALYEIKSLAQ
jgi:hypothetical protein